MNGYTKVDNWLFDHVMAKASPNTFKVVAAVVRMTAGWHEDEAEITFDDLHEMTGIGGRGTLSRAIDEAIESGYIERHRAGRTYAYSTKTVPVTSTETVPQAEEPVPKSYRNQYGNDTDNGTETVLPTSSTNKERKESERKDPPSPPLEPDIEHEIPGLPSDLRPPNDVEFPDQLRNPDFLELWWQYERHRDQIGRPLSTVSRQRALNRAAREGIDATSWLINQTLENGWQGIIWERLAEWNEPRASPNGRHENQPIPKPDPETGAW